MAPMDVIEKYSADAVRYWAASTGPGKDAVISEEKIQMGAKLATKLWNVSRFADRFIDGYSIPATIPQLSPADRWILSRTQAVTRAMTQMLENYDYAAAKGEIENFFWTELADNYLEMCKQRLYGEDGAGKDAAVFTVYKVLRSIVLLFAPFFPYITEEIFQSLFMEKEGQKCDKTTSVHLTAWPEVEPIFVDDRAELVGVKLVEIATTVRRYKSERNLSLGGELRE